MSGWTSLIISPIHSSLNHPWTTMMIPKLFYETSSIAFISQNSRVLILLDLYKQHLTELIILSAFLHLTSGDLTSLFFFPNSQLHLMFLLSFPNSTLLSTSWAHFVTISSFYGGSDGKESACRAGDLGSIPGLERCPGGGYGNTLQYSCKESDTTCICSPQWKLGPHFLYDFHTRCVSHMGHLLSWES